MLTDLSAFLEQQYGIVGPLVPIQGHLELGGKNATFQCGNWFVKAFSPVHGTDALVEQSLSIQVAVRKQGVPAALMKRTLDQALYTRVGNRYVTVMEFIPGRRVKRGGLTKETAGAVGKTLGLLHRALATLPSSHANRPRPMDADQILSGWLALRDTVRANPDPDQLDAMVIKGTDFRQQTLALFPPDQVDWESQPWQMVHGDFHLGNLRFSQSGQILAVVDFDGCGRGFPLCEVMEAWLLCCRPSVDRPRPQAEAAFLHQYLLQNPVGREQWLSMPRVYWTHLMGRLWPIPEVYANRDSYDRTWAIRLMEKREVLVHWVGKHLSELTDYLEQVLEFEHKGGAKRSFRMRV